MAAFLLSPAAIEAHIDFALFIALYLDTFIDSQ
jgi:hypothetical protein